MASSKLTVYLRAGRRPQTKDAIHAEFANLRDDGGWAFYARYGAVHTKDFLIDTDQSPEFRGTILSPAAMRATGLPCLFVDLELRDLLRRAWRWDIDSLYEIKKSAGQYMKFAWHFNKSGRAELVAEDLWNVLCILFLRDQLERKTAICENPDCVAPFFIKKRRTQKFCEAGRCVEYGARIRANRWWKAHGDEWRQGKRKGAKR